MHTIGYAYKNRYMTFSQNEVFKKVSISKGKAIML